MQLTLALVKGFKPLTIVIVHCAKEVFNLLEECCEMCRIQRYSAVELVLSAIFLNK